MAARWGSVFEVSAEDFMFGTVIHEYGQLQKWLPHLGSLRKRNLPPIRFTPR